MRVAPPTSSEPALAPTAYRPGRCCRRRGRVRRVRRCVAPGPPGRMRQRWAGKRMQAHRATAGVKAASALHWGSTPSQTRAPIPGRKDRPHQTRTLARNLSAPPSSATSLSGMSCFSATWRQAGVQAAQDHNRLGVAALRLQGGGPCPKPHLPAHAPSPSKPKGVRAARAPVPRTSSAAAPASKPPRGANSTSPVWSPSALARVRDA